MKGFTLLELMIVTLMLSVLAAAGLPAIKDAIDSHRILATVEEMKALAAASDVARRLPGGDNFSDVRTDSIAALLNAYDINSSRIPLTPKRSHWGTDFRVTTTGQYATVTVSIPLRDIDPFEAISTPNGARTTLLVSHQPQGRNRSVAVGSKYNKHHLYME